MRSSAVCLATLLASLCFTGSPNPVTAQEPAPVEAQEPSAAMKKLNRAMDKKMAAERMADLNSVVKLCEEAIDEGLDEANEQYAKQLISATLYERADRLVDSLGSGKLDVAWARRRQVALDSLNKAVKVNDQDADSLLLLAELHELPGGDKKAGLAAAEKAVELINEDPRRRSLALMTLSTFRDDPEDRLIDLDRAYLADAKNMDALRERGKTYLELEQTDQALDDFKTLLAKDPSDMESVEVVSQLLAKQDKFDEAVELIDGVIEADETSPNGYILRANVLLAKEDLEPALADLGKALELDPKHIAALLTRAQVYSADENYKEALADVSRALELRPDLYPGVILRSQIALAAGEYKQSLADLRRLLRNDPKNVGLRMQIAAVYVADNRPSMAIDMYDRLIEDNDEDWEAYRGRGDAKLGQGKHTEALEDYQRAIKGMPDDTGLLNNYAWVLATSTFDKVRDGQRAIELAKKACELTEYKAAHILSTLAAGYAEMGDFDKAIEWSNKAVELGEGEVGEQLAEELVSYKAKKPWREKQTVEEDDLAGDLDQK